MAEIGRRGGRRSPLTRLRRAVRDDEELRAKAEAALEAALDGDDEKRRFEAAKSLYSFRAAAPPAGEQARDQQDEARMHVGLFDVIGVACESKMLSSGGLMTAEAERALFERINARQDSSEAAREVARRALPPPPGKENRG
jgi:hypothetical protein